MTIYIDIILIENIVMNYIILLSTNIINKEKVYKIRLLLSSLLGGIYAVLEYIFPFQIYSNQFIKIILSIAMVYIAFKASNIKKLIKQLLIFYLTSFTFGGCAYFLLYYIKPEQIITESGKYILKIVILGAMLGFAILYTAFKIVKNRIDKNMIINHIKIHYKDNSYIVKAMLDTGNLLCDPITQTPVLIVEKEKLKNVIPPKILNINQNQIINYHFEYLEENVKSRLKIIPFKSIGNENGIIVGFKPDFIEIDFEDEILKIKDVIIGIYDNKLSRNDMYSAIFGLNLVNQEVNRKTGEMNGYHSKIKI